MTSIDGSLRVATAGSANGSRRLATRWGANPGAPMSVTKNVGGPITEAAVTQP